MTILVIAAAFDIQYMKIPNFLILISLSAGCQTLISIEGARGILVFFLRMFAPIFILYLLFLMNALGAGDIKLFSVVSVFLPGKATLFIVILSFFYGALLALLKMLYSKELFPRLFNFWLYFTKIRTERRLYSYRTFETKNSYLHFSIYIMLAAFTYFSIGGFI